MARRPQLDGRGPVVAGRRPHARWSRASSTTRRGYADRLGRLAAEHGPLVVYPEPRGDDRRDARPRVSLGRRDAAVPRRRRARTRCATRPRSISTAAGGGLANARVARSRAPPASLRAATFSRPVVVKPARPVSTLEDGAPREGRRRARSDCWTASPTTSRCWSRSGSAARSSRSSWCSTARAGVAARFQQRDAAHVAVGGRLDRARDQRRARRAPRLAARRRCSRELGYWGLAQVDFVDTDSGLRAAGRQPAVLPLPAARHRVRNEPAGPLARRHGRPPRRPARARTGRASRTAGSRPTSSRRCAARPRRLLEPLAATSAPAPRGRRVTRSPECC